MEQPLVTKKLLDEIAELSQKLDERLRANKYYAALKKLDDLLLTIESLRDDDGEGRTRPDSEASVGTIRTNGQKEEQTTTHFTG
jgi:hypothetical protein